MLALFTSRRAAAASVRSQTDCPRSTLTRLGSPSLFRLPLAVFQSLPPWPPLCTESRKQTEAESKSGSSKTLRTRRGRRSGANLSPPSFPQIPLLFPSACLFFLLPLLVFFQVFPPTITPSLPPSSSLSPFPNFPHYPRSVKLEHEAQKPERAPLSRSLPLLPSFPSSFSLLAFPCPAF